MTMNKRFNMIGLINKSWIKEQIFSRSSTLLIYCVYSLTDQQNNPVSAQWHLKKNPRHLLSHRNFTIWAAFKMHFLLCSWLSLNRKNWRTRSAGLCPNWCLGLSKTVAFYVTTHQPFNLRMFVPTVYVPYISIHRFQVSAFMFYL